jgi:hypothetical protein
MIVDIFDPEVNFWEANPQLKVINPFKDLYKEDKSKNKSKSSLMMYFVAFCYDMSPNNKFRNMPELDKHEVIGEDYCGDIKYFTKNEEVLTPLIDMYCNLQDTPALKALREWNSKMMERSKFIKDTKYGPDYLAVVYTKGGVQQEVTVTGTWDFLDKMMKITKSLYDDYQRILKDLSEEQGNDSQGKGGYTPSLNDD